MRLFSKTGCLVILGFIWVLTGVVLLPMGLNLMLLSIQDGYLLATPEKFSAVRELASYVGGLEHAAIILMVVCLLFGRIGARIWFEKKLLSAAQAIIGREGSRVGVLLGHAFKVVLVGLIFLGLGLFGGGIMSKDLLAMIEMLVGSAAIYVAFVYFRFAMAKSSQV